MKDRLHQRRYKKTVSFVKKYVPAGSNILDLGTENPFSKIMRDEGYNVNNTQGENLDTDYPKYISTNVDCVTAFEIFEHMLAPFNILRQLKTDNLTEARQYLNQVRTRAGLPDVTDSNKDILTDLIDLERRKELIWEGHRWFDLLRTGKVNTTFPDVPATRHLLPLPSVELATDPSLQQNHGY